MCELFAMSSRGPATVLKDTEGASHSKWVQFVEQQEIRSTLVLSHIRLATDGDVCTRNTQPFARELGGRMHVFVHNGHVPDIRGLSEYRSDSFRPIGDTDSEIAFCALLERVKPLWNERDVTPDLAARLETVAGFANDLGQVGPATSTMRQRGSAFQDIGCIGDLATSTRNSRGECAVDGRSLGAVW